VGPFYSTVDNQFAIRATNGVWIASDLGENRTIQQKGDRFGDNNIVAWASVASAGSITESFGITSVTRTNTGIYNVVIDVAAVDAMNICAIVMPEIDAPPTSAATIRSPSINNISGSNRFFQVFMNDGTGALVDNDFRVIVTLR